MACSRTGFVHCAHIDLPPCPNHECELGLWLQVEVVMLLGLTLQADLITLHNTVLLNVLFGTLESKLPLLLQVLKLRCTVNHTNLVQEP